MSSGEDTCDEGLQCWNVDPDTSVGTCLAMCTGTWDAPSCPGQGQECVAWYGPDQAPPGYENVGLCGVPP
ncbi:hypothetical protein [Nannocystis punicea]|uniref:Uncharacterized protein n=1 Tax=Nannocystis punicea TaxID=2995304 RepID=A0ABY7HFC7_9BACT|nr:hypothetical protein [Nannocystis poenicansa]WAS97992.1 hypothetical protein O0S08_17770 [Nannocystis poenicansa]